MSERGGRAAEHGGASSVSETLVLPNAPTDRAEHLQTLAQLLGFLRRDQELTRADLMRLSGLSRGVVSQRVGQLVELGLVEEVGLAASTGGRAPQLFRFRGTVGRLLAVSAGATSVLVAITDLNGRILREDRADLDISDGPERYLGDVEQMAEALLDDPGLDPVWGIGIGLPGPIEFTSGRPTSPPIMPGWDGYDVRHRFTARFGAPTWVDNDVNVMALGELRAGLGRGVDDMVYVKIGTGIGAGLASRGAIHRGAQGAAGDVGHVAVVDSSPVTCRCGNKGCLETLAGGAAIIRDAYAAVNAGAEGTLADLVRMRDRLTVAGVGRAAQQGDPVALRLLAGSGTLVGEMLATLVSFYNPALVVLGGSVAEARGAFLAGVREEVYRRSLRLATRDLRIEVSTLGASAGLIGAAALALNELFVPTRLEEWIAQGLPERSPASVSRHVQGAVS